MPGTIQSRLARLEERTRRRKAKPDGNCICRPQHLYIVLTDATPAETAALLPRNREHCPKCGGKGIAIAMTKEDARG